MKIATLALAALALVAPLASAQVYQPTTGSVTYGTTTQVGAPIYAQPVAYQNPAQYYPQPVVPPFYYLTAAEVATPSVKKLVDAAIKAQKAVQTAITKAGEYFNDTKNSAKLIAYYNAKARSEFTKLAVDITATKKAKTAAKVQLEAYEKLVAAVEVAQKALTKADKAVQTKATAVIKARK